MPTKAEMRVVIAKDVIKQVKAKRIKPKRGVYIGSSAFQKQFDDAYAALYVKGVTGTAATKIKARKVQVPKKCDACALGSCMISALDKYNKLNVGNLVNDLANFNAGWDREEIIKYLCRWFARHQLNLIEDAFEYKEWHDTSSPPRTFGEKYPTSSKRLVAIMQNIIKNKGTFVP
jgi:hypothetical protein